MNLNKLTLVIALSTTPLISSCKFRAADDAELLVTGGHPIGENNLGVVYLNNGLISCTGVFISHEWVLTSAACAGIGRFPTNEQLKTQRTETHSELFPEASPEASKSSLKQFGLGLMRSAKTSPNFRPIAFDSNQLSPGRKFKIAGYGCTSADTASANPVLLYGTNQVDSKINENIIKFAGQSLNSPNAFNDSAACTLDKLHQSVDEGAPILNDKNEVIGITLYGIKEGGGITTYAVDLSSTKAKAFIQQHILSQTSSSGSYIALNFHDGDQRFSNFGGDWNPRFRKGQCKDGSRLIGVARDGRSLCTNTSVSMGTPDLAQKSAKATDDWAKGQIKSECPSNYYLAGLSMEVTPIGIQPSIGLCIKTNNPQILGSSCRTVWFQDGDDRPSSANGGDFAVKSFKGQCSDNEYIKGFSAYFYDNSRAYYSSIRCCNLP